MPKFLKAELECDHCKATTETRAIIDPWGNLRYTMPPGWSSFTQVKDQRVWCPKEECHAEAVHLNVYVYGNSLYTGREEA